MNSGSSWRKPSSLAGREPRVDHRVDPGGDPLGGDRRRRLALAVRLAGPVEEGRDPLHRRGPFRQGLGAGGVDLDDQRPADVGLGVEEVEQRPQPGAQLALSRSSSPAAAATISASSRSRPAS